MKKLLTLLAFAAGFGTVRSQTTTIILLRHAEKDTSVAGSAAMQADPPLSITGQQRAAKLPEVLKAYTPDAIYSTGFVRTRSTVTPLARKFNKEIEVYDPRKLPALADQLLQLQGKTVVVVGHSNTTPALVNLLVKEPNKYPNLDDAVYNQYWIVTIKDGKAEAKQLQF